MPLAERISNDSPCSRTAHGLVKRLSSVVSGIALVPFLDDLRYIMGMDTARVISPRVLAYFRGGKAFKDGKPCPPRPPDDSQCTEPHEIEWLGWMVARAEGMERRRQVMNALGVDGD